MKHSASYFSCIRPRKSKFVAVMKKRGAVSKERGSLDTILEGSDDSISNGESYSLSSIAD